MTIYGVSVSATDLSPARAFYELLGFRFPEAEPEHSHLEAEDDCGVRLLVDCASSLAELYGAPRRPSTTAGFAVIVTSPNRWTRRSTASGRPGTTSLRSPTTRPGVTGTREWPIPTGTRSWSSARYVTDARIQWGP